jgi:hypothetical protein
MVDTSTDTPPATCATLDRAKRVLRVLKLALGSVATALTIAKLLGLL